MPLHHLSLSVKVCIGEGDPEFILLPEKWNILDIGNIIVVAAAGKKKVAVKTIKCINLFIWSDD